MSTSMAQPAETLSTLTLRGAAPATALAHRLTPTHGLSSTGVALIALAAVVVLLCVVWGLSRVLTFEPRWTLTLRHAMAEASYRASGTWAEFSDWARLGR
jgi:hypothetical protein